MKKVSLVFTLLLVATMLLAACGGGTPSNQGGDTGVLETPLATLDTGATGLETETPAGTIGGETTMTETPMVDTTPTVEETTEATEEATTEATEEATTEATGTATPETTTGGTTGGTGQAMTPAYARFSDFSAMTVQDSAGAEIGTVNGVVVMVKGASGSTSSSDGSTSGGSTTDATATPESSSGSGGSTDATATPEASSGGSTTDATATPESATGSGSTTTDTASTMDGQVTYVVVSPSTSFGETNTNATTGNSLLIPWTAFESSGSSTSSDTTTGGSSTEATATPESSSSEATATPEASSGGSTTDATATPESSTGTGSTTTTLDENVLMLTISADELATAPVVADAELASMSGGTLNEEIGSFWSGQGMPIPATGPTTGAAYVPVILQKVSSYTVVDQQGNELGKIADFVVDRANGRVSYAVVNATGNNIPVPMNHFSFQSAGTDSSTTGMSGQFVIDVSQNEFSGAPAIEGWDMTDFSADPTWNTDLDRYWFGLE